MTICATAQAEGHRYTLAELVQIGRERYPGVEAVHHALTAAHYQLIAAKWAWVPKAEITGLVAPAIRIQCFDANGNRSTDNCVRTDNFNINLFKIDGVFARIQLDLEMPIYTFEKLSSEKDFRAATVASKEAEMREAQNDIELKVARAYWGLKLSQEILYAIRNGRTYLDKAITRIEEQMEDGDGESTMTDLLRLKTVAAEVDARTAEAEKLEIVTRSALAMLARDNDGEFSVDEEILAEFSDTPAPVDVYLELAQHGRPTLHRSVANLEAARAQANAKKARLFPDLLLTAMFGVGGATNVDDPHNAFFNDPFNFYTANIGLTLRWALDPVGHYNTYRAARAEAQEAEARLAQERLDTALEVQRIYQSLIEARDRLAATQQGQKAARSWLVATSQNMEAGLASSRDLNDALIGYFQIKAKYLQAQYDVNVAWAELARAIGRSPRAVN